ncbi:MAG: hypothetical protein M1820_005912 [Bogoriella megaspora]|nr:MAG: hypothetical protein M1820_005912 [Bogoriella megaspora]
MLQLVLLVAANCIKSCLGTSSTFDIPRYAGSGSHQLDPAPVSFSFEFPYFPSYFVNISNTYSCIGEFQKLTGTWPGIRIGGTTEDESVFDVTLKTPVITVNKSLFHFGLDFFKIAAKYEGKVVLGLNRGTNNKTNTISAAKAAKEIMRNLYAIELGNEPVPYTYHGFPIVENSEPWTPATEAASESEWQIALGNALYEDRIIQAGNFVLTPDYGYSAAELLRMEDPAALKYIKDFSHHNYPQTVANTTIVPHPNLKQLMNHSVIVANVRQFESDVPEANDRGFDYVFGETNSVSGGGSPEISKTFGAALWVLDYTLRAASIGIKRIYFHHGPYTASFYVWWTPFGITSPLYGGYMATAAMAGGSFISSLDDGTSTKGGYVIYSARDKPMGIVLINSDYYDGSNTRLVHEFVLKGLNCSSVRATRLTAASALSRQDYGDMPTFGGRTISNTTCRLQGHHSVERIQVSGGTAMFELAASEALLIDI